MQSCFRYSGLPRRFAPRNDKCCVTARSKLSQQSIDVTPAITKNVAIQQPIDVTPVITKNVVIQQSIDVTSAITKSVVIQQSSNVTPVIARSKATWQSRKYQLGFGLLEALVSVALLWVFLSIALVWQSQQSRRLLRLLQTNVAYTQVFALLQRFQVIPQQNRQLAFLEWQRQNQSLLPHSQASYGCHAVCVVRLSFGKSGAYAINMRQQT